MIVDNVSFLLIILIKMEILKLLLFVYINGNENWVIFLDINMEVIGVFMIFLRIDEVEVLKCFICVWELNLLKCFFCLYIFCEVCVSRYVVIFLL